MSYIEAIEQHEKELTMTQEMIRRQQSLQEETSVNLRQMLTMSYMDAIEEFEKEEEQQLYQKGGCLKAPTVND